MALPTTTNMQRQIDSNGRIIRRRSPREQTKITPSLIVHRALTTPPTTTAMAANHHRYMTDNNKYSGNGSILLDGVIRLQITDRTNDKRLQNTHLRHRNSHRHYHVIKTSVDAPAYSLHLHISIGR